MDSIRPAIPGVTPDGSQEPAEDQRDDFAGVGPSPLDDAAAAIAGVMPGGAPQDLPVPVDEETSDPEALDPPLVSRDSSTR